MNRMKLRWPKFSLRSVLVATCWCAIAFYFWSLDTRRTTANFTVEVLVLYGLRTVPLFVAIGTLLQRPIIAFSIGCGLFILILLAALFAIVEFS